MSEKRIFTMTKDRFRFRVWDTEKKEMIYGAEMAYDYMRLCPGGKIIEENCFGDVLENKRYIVEQCTCLKDKNGRIIYEGDIVKRHSKYSEDEKDVVLQVEWNRKGARYITTDKKHDSWIFSMFDYEYEILGNIHENPELLEEKK